MGWLEGAKHVVKDELIEIIEWLDSSRDTLAYRFEDHDHEIKRGARLIVRESQAAQFVYEGQYADLFQPGLHTLTTANIPVLTTLKGWKYGFESPFKAEVYFLTTRLFAGNKWGTAHPVLLRDADLGLVRARAFGTYDVRITAPALFLREIVGTSPVLGLETFAETMRARIVSVFSEMLAVAAVPIIDAATRYRELGRALTEPINAVLSSTYGLTLGQFVIENVSVPSEVEAAIDKRASLGAIGNLDEYVKLKLADSFATGGGGMAKMGAELAAGMALGQQLAAVFAPKAKADE